MLVWAILGADISAYSEPEWPSLCMWVSGVAMDHNEALNGKWRLYSAYMKPLLVTYLGTSDYIIKLWFLLYVYDDLALVCKTEIAFVTFLSRIHELC